MKTTTFRRAGATAAVLASLGLGLAGCSDSKDVPSAGPSRSPAASAPASPAPSTSAPSAPSAEGGPQVEQATVSAPTVSDAAERQFGQMKSLAGYAEVSQFVQQETFRPEVLKHKDTYTAADFARAGDAMTPSCRASWNDTVTRAVAGDRDAANSVDTISYFSITGPGIGWAKSGPLVTNHVISGGQVGVDTTTGSPRLEVTVTDHGDLRLTENGSPVRAGTDKTVTYWLVSTDSSTGQTWQIDGWSGTFQSHAATPDVA